MTVVSADVGDTGTHRVHDPTAEPAGRRRRVHADRSSGIVVIGAHDRSPRSVGRGWARTTAPARCRRDGGAEIGSAPGDLIVRQLEQVAEHEHHAGRRGQGARTGVRRRNRATPNRAGAVRRQRR
jgi:hypothetical protein